MKQRKLTWPTMAIIGSFACVIAAGLLIATPFAAQAYAAQVTAADASLEASSDLQTQAVTKYPIVVGGQRVTSKNAKNVLGDKKKSVVYNAKTNTLTLKNAKITKGFFSQNDKGNSWGHGILCATNKKFTVKLVGKNSVTAPSTHSPFNNYGVCTYGNLVITGSGSLTTKAMGAQAFTGGIMANSLTIQGSAKVTSKGSSTKITDPHVGYSSNNGGYGVIVQKTFTIKGSAKLTAVGAKKAFYPPFNPSFKFASGYTPQVKAGSSSNSIKVNKKKPATSVYTKYKYVNITKAKATSKTPAKATITSISAGANSLKLNWKKLSTCTGYQLQLSTNSSFASDSTWDFTTSSQEIDGATLTSLTSGAKYYVRIRGVNTVGSKTYYGAWSATKSATVY